MTVLNTRWRFEKNRQTLFTFKARKARTPFILTNFFPNYFNVKIDIHLEFKMIETENNRSQFRIVQKKKAKLKAKGLMALLA